MLGAGGAAVVGAGVALVLVSRRLERAGPLGVLGAAVVTVAMAVSVLAAASPPPGWSEAGGARLFRHESAVVVVLDEQARPRDLLQSLRLAGVRRVDLVVASRGGASDAHAVLALKDRYRTAAVVAPEMHRVPGARTVRAGDIVQVGTVEVEVVSDAPGLVVEITGGGGPGGRIIRPL